MSPRMIKSSSSHTSSEGSTVGTVSPVCSSQGTNNTSTSDSEAPKPPVSDPDFLKPRNDRYGILDEGFDESLWNEDRTRYAGMPTSSPDFFKEALEAQGTAAFPDLMMRAFHKYVEHGVDMTPKEKEQQDRWRELVRKEHAKLPPPRFDEEDLLF